MRAPPQINKADIALMEAYANYDVEPVMKELLQELMITRPADVTGFALQTLASMHMKKGQELLAFPAESGVPLNRLNPIIASSSRRSFHGWQGSLCRQSGVTQTPLLSEESKTDSHTFM